MKASIPTALVVQATPWRHVSGDVADRHLKEHMVTISFSRVSRRLFFPNHYKLVENHFLIGV